MKSTPIIFFCLMLVQHIFGDSQNNFNQALSNGKNILSQAGGLLGGLAESVGYVPPEYVYSFIVFNDSPFNILVLREDVIQFMGATFNGTIEPKSDQALTPFSNSGSIYYNKHLLFTVWLLANQALENQAVKIDNLWNNALSAMKIKNLDINFFDQIKFSVPGVSNVAAAFSTFFSKLSGVVLGEAVHESLKKYAIFQKTIPLQKFKADDYYYYRAYFASDAKKKYLRAEYLGALATTDQFVGTFYNSTNTPISLDFIKDNKEYTVTLEPNTFSLLHSSSTVPNSIRPQTLLDENQKPSRVFTFKRGGSYIIGQIPIQPQGIANVDCDPKTNKCTTGAPKNYTYEVFTTDQGLTVGIQGLSIGKYQQSYPADKNVATRVVRDINPCQCYVWAQSADQYNKTKAKDSSSSAINFQEQLWVYYQTKDMTIKQKIQPGTVIDFTLLRPQIAEETAWLYIVALQTSDDNKAQQFLTKLASGKIGKNVTAAQIDNFSKSENLNEILNNPTVNQYGLVQDTDSGVSGYVLVVDGFRPRGLGTGPFYYTVQPPLLIPDRLAMMAQAYMEDSAKADEFISFLNQKLPEWITSYATNANAVKTEVLQMCQKYWSSYLFKDAAKTALNIQGQVALDLLLNGPISIANPPLLQQAGTNNYVFTLGVKPDGWPS